MVGRCSRETPLSSWDECVCVVLPTKSIAFNVFGVLARSTTCLLSCANPNGWRQGGLDCVSSAIGSEVLVDAHAVGCGTVKHLELANSGARLSTQARNMDGFHAWQMYVYVDVRACEDAGRHGPLVKKNRNPHFKGEARKLGRE